ncbi:unnamed protein product, partial [Rotaria magnacalcarata]
NMGKRGGGATGGGAPAATGSGGRSNLYQQMYHNGVRNAVKINDLHVFK